MIQHFKKVAHPVITGLFVFILTILPFGSNFIQAAGSFTDIAESHLHFEAIEYLRSKNIIGGYPDRTFKPDKQINRAEFVKMIINAEFGEERASACDLSKADNVFPDVTKDIWYAKYVCLAKEKKIIAGYPDGTFKGENLINFAEASKIIVNTLIEKTKDGSPWYKPYIEKLGNQKAIPSSIETFGQYVNRAQTSEIYYRLLTKNKNKLSLSFHELEGSADPNVGCEDKTAFAITNQLEYLDVVGDIKKADVNVSIKNTGSGNLTDSGSCSLKFYDEKDNLITTSFSAIKPQQETDISVSFYRDQACDQHTIKMKADHVADIKEMIWGSGDKNKCEQDFYYVVFDGWSYGTNTGTELFGAIFNHPIFNEAYVIKNSSGLEKLFAPLDEDNCSNSDYFSHHKALKVQVVSESIPYNFGGVVLKDDHKNMLENYKTDRWYKIKYEKDGKTKMGYIPVSGVVKNDPNLFKVTVKGKNNVDCYHYSIYWSYPSSPLKGYGTSEEIKINKILLHNTVDDNMSFNGIGGAVNYFLARNTDGEFSNRLVTFVPEYISGGSLDNFDRISPRKEVDGSIRWRAEYVNAHSHTFDVEQSSISVEMVNASKLPIDIQDEKFNNFKLSDLDNRFKEISGNDYDMVKYYYKPKHGFQVKLRYFESDLLNYYDHSASEKRYKLKSGLNDEQKNNLLVILNRIPFDYSYGGISAFDIVDIYGSNNYNITNSKDVWVDLKNSRYFHRYTEEQYSALEKFLAHMNEKYGVALQTIDLHEVPYDEDEPVVSNDLRDNYAKYGYFFQVPYYNDLYSKFVGYINDDFSGIISHRNHSVYGKGCASPAFITDYISNINK